MKLSITNSNDASRTVLKFLSLLSASEGDVWKAFFEEHKEYISKMPENSMIFLEGRLDFREGFFYKQSSSLEKLEFQSPLDEDDFYLAKYVSEHKYETDLFKKGLTALEPFLKLCYGWDWSLLLVKQNGVMIVDKSE